VARKPLEKFSVRATAIKWSLIPLLCLLTSPSQSQTTDLEYVKAVDPVLYQKLLKIQQCQKQQQSAEQCKATLHGSTVPQQAKAPSKPRDWWNVSAFDGPGPLPQWYHGLQSEASLNKMNGNISGSQYSAKIQYYTRYNAWTNSIYIGYSKDNISQSDVLVSNRRNRLLNLGTRYDLGDTWYGQAGYTHEQDSILSIKDKNIRYVGVGAFLGDSPTRKLNLLMAIGRQTENFSEQTSVATGQFEFDYSIAYLYQQFDWALSKSLNFKQTFSIVHGIDDLPNYASIDTAQCIETFSEAATYCVEGYNKPNNSKFTMGLEYKFNQYISLLYNISVNHDSQPLLDDQSDNSSHNIGIQASFQ
jgi:hypothetical protein